VNQSFVSRAIARYYGTGSVARRQGSGRKKMAISPEMTRQMAAKIYRNRHSVLQKWLLNRMYLTKLHDQTLKMSAN
jgi:hypothetical protein